MYSIEGKTFSAFLSRKNIQQLTDCGGINKYFFKYIGNIGKKWCCNIYWSKRLAHHKIGFLHNTKTSTSKINEDNANGKWIDMANIRWIIIFILKCFKMYWNVLKPLWTWNILTFKLYLLSCVLNLIIKITNNHQVGTMIEGIKEAM